MLSLMDTREWIGIACRRYGVSRTPEENPITVVVSVRKESTTTSWTTATHRVQGILSQFGVSDVDVLFQKNEIIQHVEDPIVDRAACSGWVQPGVSIGIHMSTAGSSTLGGLVQLRFNQGWRTFGLTAFDCVWAPPEHRQSFDQVKGAKKAFDRWQIAPVRPGDDMAGRLLRIDHPSVQDLKHKVTHSNEQIFEMENQKFKNLEQQIRESEANQDNAFVDPREKSRYNTRLRIIRILKADCEYVQDFINTRSYILGSVFAGSGLYRVEDQSPRQVNQPFILDWALVEIPESRLGPNLPYRYPQERAPVPFDDVGDPQIGQFYAKAGRSTGFTTGERSGLKEVTIHRVQDPVTGQWEEKVTWEYAIYAGANQIFTSRGTLGPLCMRLHQEKLLASSSQQQNMVVTLILPP